MVVAVIDTVIALRWSEHAGRIAEGSRLPIYSG